MNNKGSYIYDGLKTWETVEKPKSIADLIKENPAQKELIIEAGKIAIDNYFFRSYFVCAICGKILTKAERYQIQKDVMSFNYCCKEHYEYRKYPNPEFIRKLNGIEYVDYISDSDSN